MRKRIIAGLDIGTSNIIAALARVDANNSIDSLDIVESDSDGVKRGIVSDLEKLTSAIHTTITKLQNKTKTKISDVYVNIKGDHIITRNSRAAIPLVDKLNRSIRQSDIAKVNDQARLLGLGIEERVVHDFTQNYIIDDFSVFANPLGLFGRKLEVDVYLIVTNIAQINNLVKAINQAGLEVSDIAMSGWAASLVLLNLEQKQRGCILIDIGVGTTDMLFFKNGILRQLATIAFGGSDITESLASHLKLPLDLADDLKRSYGLVCSADIETNKEILIKQDEHYRPIQQKQICEAIEREVGKLTSLIKEKLNSYPTIDRANSDIVITGGTALLSGLLEKIENELEISVRVGRIKNINFPSSKTPLYATAVGLVYYGINKSSQKNAGLAADRNLIFRGLRKIKEVYQEYF